MLFFCVVYHERKFVNMLEMSNFLPDALRLFAHPSVWGKTDGFNISNRGIPYATQKPSGIDLDGTLTNKASRKIITPRTKAAFAAARGVRIVLVAAAPPALSCRWRGTEQKTARRLHLSMPKMADHRLQRPATLVQHAFPPDHRAPVHLLPLLERGALDLRRSRIITENASSPYGREEASSTRSGAPGKENLPATVNYLPSAAADRRPVDMPHVGGADAAGVSWASCPSAGASPSLSRRCRWAWVRAIPAGDAVAPKARPLPT